MGNDPDRFSEGTDGDARWAEAFFGLIPDIAVSLDSRGRIAYVNRYGRKLLGGDESADLVGRDWFGEFIRPGDRRAVRRVFRQTMASEPDGEGTEHGHYRNRIVALDGQERVIEWHNRTVRDSDGRAIGIASVGRDVTESVETGKRLEESEAKFRSMVEMSNDITLRINLKGELQYISPQISKYGEDPVAVLGRNFTEFVHPDFRKELRRLAIQRFFHPDGKFPPFEFIATLDGGRRQVWMQVWSGAIRDKRGRVREIVSVMRDIDDRKRSEIHFKELVENLTVGVYRREFGPNGRFLEGNPAALAILGAKSVDQVPNMNIEDICQDPEDYRHVERELAEKGVIRGFEMGIKTLKGKLAYIRLTAILKKGSDGKAYSDVIVEDITAERATIERIRESEERYRVLAENTPQDIILIDVDGRLLFMNRPALNRYGFGDVAEAGRKFRLSGSFVGEDRRRVEDLIDMGRQGKVSTVELESVDAGGVSRTMQVIFAPVRDSKGTVSGIVVVGSDVSELRAMRRQVDELDQLKSRFMTSLLHVTRTPLSKIRWALEILQSGEIAPVAPGQSAFIRQALSSGNTVISVMENMTLALDIERGALTLDRTFTSVVSLVQSVRQQFSARHEMDGVECVIDAPDTDIKANVDIHRLHRVFETVLDNASRYLRDSERRILIRIRTVRGRVRFEFEDHGIGIPANEQGYVFGRFYRGSNAQLAHPDGVGLGLFISRAVVEAHGGTMGFSSREGKGSVFWMELPVGDGKAGT
ncbi:PAS domain S-box protein [Candidatus Uhrbacteria bacterium]|nr:PAS domain S-box protein [Candidatus Uhrbacteria bacterium]